MVRDLAKLLKRDGFKSGEIHGDMDQASRIAELDRFKSGQITVLVASDVAARGIDVKGVSHVINYDTPWHPDDYVHRIGRTGRAGATGHAYTLVTAKDAEAIDNVQKLIGVKIPWDDALGGGAPAAKSAPREDAAVEEAPAKRARPSRAKPKAEEPAMEAAAVEARPAESKPAPAREEPRNDRPKRDRAPRREREPATPERGPRYQQQDAEEDGAWNGPVPGFLGFGFGGQA